MAVNVLLHPAEQEHRARWLKIAVAVWLTLTSAITLVNSVGLSHLAEQAHHREQAMQLKALDARVAQLAQRVNAERRQPKPASQAEFAAARRALESRLAHLEQSQADMAHASDVQALQARITEIEARQSQTRAASAVTRTPRRQATVKPKTPEPPFRVIGVELRGGERFLSIAAPTATTLGSIRLLREGDSGDGWQLQSIGAHAALFQVNGQTQRVAFPWSVQP